MKRVRGFSLVELMVAITLALIVTAGVISVFVGSRSAFEATSGTAALTDGGRFALDFISNSVRNAGYMSCTTARNVIGILNAAPTPLKFSFGQALGGYEASNTGVNQAYTVAPWPVAGDGNNGDWLGGLDTALSAAPNGSPVQNNDVLVVRSTLKDAQSVYLTSAIGPGSSTFTVNTQGPLQIGQLAVISDCATGIVFQITGIGLVGPNQTITHAASGSPGNNPASFQLNYAAGAQIAPVDTVVYYIAPGADQDSALWVADLNATGTFTTSELVPDIEAMQILYGVDTTNAQIVSGYVTADQVGDFNTVMSIKVALLAASAPGSAHPTGAKTYNLLGVLVTTPNDTRSRQVFEETIAVRNSLP
jgi:type IV pilus assembly protein PilW